MANPSLLDLVIQKRLITAKTLPAYLEEARKTENTEAVAKLMEYAAKLQIPGSSRGRLDPPAHQAQPGITQDPSVQNPTHTPRGTRGMEDFKTSKGVLIEYTGRDHNVAIPEGVTKIGKQAFNNCVSLESVAIPEGVTEINDGAFYSCKSLKSVSIPEGVTEIGKGAFKDCESLKSVAIPGSVTRIYGSAFSGCKSLETVAIPGSVTEIGGLAFDGCESIHLNGTSLPVIGKGAFRGCKFIRINGNTPSAIGKDAFIYIPALGDMLPERIWVENLESLEPALKPAAVLTFAEDPSGSDQRRASHIKYIKSHIPLTVANPSLLDLAIRERVITAKTLPTYLDEAHKTGNTETVAKLMEYAETLQKPGSDLEL